MFKSYLINRPFQLPWMYVSPTEDKGVEYHLSTNLSLKIEGIFSGNDEFIVGNLLLALEGIETNEIEAEQIFLNEFFPAKSKERIAKSFKTELNSCFFSTKHMEYFHNLFEEKNFIASNVSVIYNNRYIDNIVELPRKDFDLVMKAFGELNVIGGCDIKDHSEEMQDLYYDNFEKNAGKIELQEREKKSLWGKLKSSVIKKRLGVAFTSSFLGVAGMVAKVALARRGGLLCSSLAVVVGTIGIFLEIFATLELQDSLRILRSERVY